MIKFHSQLMIENSQTYFVSAQMSRGKLSRTLMKYGIEWFLKRKFNELKTLILIQYKIPDKILNKRYQTLLPYQLMSHQSVKEEIQ